MSRPTVCALFACLLVPACSGTRQTGRSVFHFERGGQTYEVISLSLASGEGVNYLLRRDSNRVVLRARDEDQDGHIDQVLIGSEGITEVDSIYAAGIAEAKRRGQFAQREPTRVYLVTRPTGVYSIRSVMLGPGSWYNAFTVSDAEGTREVFLLDTDADGQLDETDLDPQTMSRWQSVYRSVLDEGLRVGRVRRTVSGYLVL